MRLKFTLLLLIVAFGFGIRAHGAELQIDRLSLKAAVAEALESNPSLKESAEKINQTRSEMPLAKASLYPSVVAVVNDVRTKDALNGGTPKFGGDPYNQYSSSIKLNQVLFQRGGLSGVDAADKDVRISKLDADITKRDLVTTVIEAYYQILLSEKSLQILLGEEKIAKETVQVSSKRERSGRSQLLDSLQAKTQLELLHGQLSTAENNLQVASANLANLLGQQSADRKFSLAQSLEFPKIDEIERLHAKSESTVPEIERDKIALDRIIDERRILSGQNLPSLGLVGSYNFNTFNDPELFKSEANSWTLGLQLTIPLFSGFSSIYQDRALISQQGQLQFNRVALENRFSYQQTTSRRNLESANASIQTGQVGLELAIASSNEARRNYRLATIDFLQYLSVQQARAQAELALNTYKYNYVVALVSYFVASGQDLGELVDLLDKYSD
jgi:outer membrane protein